MSASTPTPRDPLKIHAHTKSNISKSAGVAVEFYQPVFERRKLLPQTKRNEWYVVYRAACHCCLEGLVRLQGQQ
jgi:hypothetical protein